MRWLPSTTTRYMVLGMSLMVLLAVLDGLARSVANYEGVGMAVTLWACFGVVYAWLLLEPMIDSAMVLHKIEHGEMVDRVRCLATSVARDGNMPLPKFCVYKDSKFDVMTVGIGKAVTVFISEPAAMLGDVELRAIMAHEFGHIRLGHSVTRLCLYGSLLALAMLGNGTPIVAMLANIFVLWTMRQMEFAADGAAALIVGGESVKTALRTVEDLLGDAPKWQTYFSTHPRFSDRIERLG